MVFAQNRSYVKWEKRHSQAMRNAIVSQPLKSNSYPPCFKAMNSSFNIIQFMRKQPNKISMLKDINFNSKLL